MEFGNKNVHCMHCGRGGTGRRAALRSLWEKSRGSSILLDRTISKRLMYFSSPLISGMLIKRYKRFLADIELFDGSFVTAHCPNTGAMRGLLEKGRTILCSKSDNPSRKYAHTLEGIEENGVMVGINTHRPNVLVKEGLEVGFFDTLKEYVIQSEVSLHGATRIDFKLTKEQHPPCFVEVKNVHYKVGEGAFFPDSVTVRGQKHLRELMMLKGQGCRCVMIYVIQRGDVSFMSFAHTIDPLYAALAKEAYDAGVEMVAVTAKLDAGGLFLSQSVPVIF